MSNIYLFRHGQSEFNLSKTFTGWLDAKLTPLGVEQAKALGQMLKDKKINVAYTSRLSRAIDTLNEVLKFHPECQNIITDDRMIERSYGDLAGHTHAETIENMVKNNLINGIVVGPTKSIMANLLLMSKSELNPLLMI